VVTPKPVSSLKNRFDESFTFAGNDHAAATEFDWNLHAGGRLVRVIAVALAAMRTNSAPNENAKERRKRDGSRV